jgi:hypothetical protein
MAVELSGSYNTKDSMAANSISASCNLWNGASQQIDKEVIFSYNLAI